MPRLVLRPLEARIAPVAGALDPSFGGDGLVLFDAPGFSSVTAEDVLVQPDGAAVVAGAADGQAALFRLTPDGTLDPTFAGDGVAAATFGGQESRFYGIARRPDGKLVAAGTVRIDGNYMVLVARYNANGTLDTTFSGNGFVTTDLTPRDENGFSVALQTDGKVVVCGNILSDQDDGFLFLRYTAGGALDPTFGGDGIQKYNSGGSGSLGRAVVVQADGKIVGAGHGSPIGSPGREYMLVRLNADGSFDTAFSGDGVATVAFGGSGLNEAFDVALAPDDRIVVGGTVAINNGGQIGIARFLPDGTPDPTFDGDGRVLFPLPGVDYAAAEGIVVQPDGKIIAAGRASFPGSGNSLLLRLNADGTFDDFFGAPGTTLIPGVVSTDVANGGFDHYYAVALAPDDRIVTTGTTLGRVTVGRYLGDSELPPTAVDDVYEMDGSPFTVTAAAGVLVNDIEPDGRPLTAVLVTPPDVGTLALAPDGSFTFTYPGTFSAATTFTYKVNNGIEDGTTATVTLVLATNQPPTAITDSYTLPFATELVVPAAAGVLANDTDPEGDALTATLVTPPPVGALTLNPNGSFTYSYPGELVGAVTFTYRVSDAGGPGTIGTVTLTRENLIDTRFGILTVIGSDRAESVRLLPSGSKVIVEVQTADGIQRTTATPTAPATSFSQAVVYLGAGDDRLDTAALNRSVRANAGPGNDTVKTGAGNDVLFGGIGDDLIAAGNGRNEVYAGEGNNRVTTGTGADTVVAGGGDNQVDTGGGSNVVTLGDGSNVVTTGSGTDVVTAGGGANDISTGGADRVTVGDGGNVVDAGSGGDVVVSGGGADRLFGGSGNDVIEGRGGNDLIDGGLGHDLLAAGLGTDLVEGGAGNDILFDGHVSPSRPTDTLSKLLAMYDPSRRSTLVTLTNRFTVTPDTASDALTGGLGTDWFWTAGADDLDRVTGEAMNAVT